MRKRIAFRVDAGHNIGIGHLIRCIRLAQQCVLADMDVAFITPGLPWELTELIQEYQHITLTDFIATDNNCHQIDLCIIDLSHKSNIEQPKGVDEFITHLSQQHIDSLLIDGLYRECLLQKLIRLPTYALFPYHASTGYASAQKETLIGAKFAILPTDTIHLTAKPIAEKAQQLLISFGGSDPYEYSLKIAKLLLASEQKFSITVVIGPAFKPRLKEQIKQLAVKAENLKIVEHAKNLAPYFNGTDIAIISTGLTKYEVAVQGIPAVHISINDTLKKINHEFCSHLGIQDFGPTLLSDRFQSYIEALARNKLDRESISRLSQELVDGKGCLRVVEKIAKWIQ